MIMSFFIERLGVERPCFVSRGHDLVSRGHDLVSRGHDLVSRGHDLVSRGHDYAKEKMIKRQDTTRIVCF